MNAFQQWECPMCWDLYADKQAAQTCCDPKQLPEWLCEECENEYESKEDAEKCCTEKEEDE